MKTRTRIASLSLIVLVSLVTAGCASSGKAAGTAKDSSGCPTTLAITPSDASKTLCVAVGGTVTINLNTPGGPWQPIEVSGNVLKVTGTPSTPLRGNQSATYTASTKGTAGISAAHAACPQSPGMISCHAIELWKVTVQVK